MDMLKEFKRARPDVEEFTTIDAELLWARTLGASDTAVTESAPPDGYDKVGDLPALSTIADGNISVGTRRAGSRRLVGLMAAAAVILLMVGMIAVESRSGSDTDSVAESPAGVGSVTAGIGWTAFPHPAIEPRFQYAATSTTDGVFVWGGCCVNEFSENFNDGAYFERSTGAWRVLPPAPLDTTRGDAVVTWNGSEVIAVDGVNGAVAAAFDPTSFTWRSIAAPPFETVTNGGSVLQPLDDGRVVLATARAVSIWDPVADSWTAPVTVDGLSNSDDPNLWSTRPASTSSTVATLTADSNGESTVDCSTVKVRAFDIASSTWSTFALGTTDWLPSAVVGLDGTRFLVAGGYPCAGEREGEVTPRATIVDTATQTSTSVTSPPTEVDGRRYGPALAGDAAVFFGTDGRLTVYRPNSDEWSIGNSILDADSSDTPFIDETPLVWFDDQIIVISPGYGRSDQDETSCCYPSASAWQTSLPTGIDPSFQTKPPTPKSAATSIPANPIDPTDVAQPDNGVLLANAAASSGLAGRYRMLLQTDREFNLHEPVNATQLAQTTVVYATLGNEPLATSLIERLGLTGLEPQPMPAAPPVEPSANLDGVGVLVLLGNDLPEPELPDTTDLSVAILHPPDRTSDADALVAALARAGVKVDAVIESTRSFEQSMLMPIGEFHESSFTLLWLLGIGGFDTWTPELAAAELPNSITDVIQLGTDAPSILSALTDQTG